MPLAISVGILLSCASTMASPAGSPSASNLPNLADVPKVRAKLIEVHFNTPNPGTVQAVDLWYTYDAGATWSPYDFDPQPRRSPVTFVAPSEGLCGLFVILRNEAGASAPPPKAGTKPQQWAFIDWTPPLVQLHLARKDLTFEQSRRVALKWTAYDKHLSNRPVDLYYMIKGQSIWRPIDLRLPNVQRYDWRVPAQVGGQVIIKLVVTDRCGNVVQRFSEPLDIEASARPVEVSMPKPSPSPIRTSAMANQPLNLDALADPPASIYSGEPAPGRQLPADTIEPEPRERASSPASKPDTTSSPAKIAAAPQATSDLPTARLDGLGRLRVDTSKKHPTTVAAAVVTKEPAPSDVPPPGPAKAEPPKIDSKRAQQLYRAATYYRLRGLHGHPADLALAILRFREALEADPTHTSARLDLAGVLLLQDKSEEAHDVYSQLLTHQPTHRDALQGLALTQVRLRQYDSAKKTLMRLVGLYPDDAEAWLNLGDVCLTSGDVASARTYWSRATTAQPDADDLVQKARLRLSNHQPLPLARSKR